jgi:hypothetical protein
MMRQVWAAFALGLILDGCGGSGVQQSPSNAGAPQQVTVAQLNLRSWTRH